MTHLPGATVPAAPFLSPVPIPTLGAGDVCLSLDAAWLPYLIGCAKVLTANSTWASDDPTLVAGITSAANNLLDLLFGAACNMTINFAPSTDNGDAGDGQVHVTIMPDPTVSDRFDVSVQHPAWITASQIPPDDDTGLLSKTPTTANPNVIRLNVADAEAVQIVVNGVTVAEIVAGGHTAIFSKNTNAGVSQTDAVIVINGSGSGAPLLETNP